MPLPNQMEIEQQGFGNIQVNSAGACDIQSPTILGRTFPVYYKDGLPTSIDDAAYH
jgi:hypothetical protein